MGLYVLRAHLALLRQLPVLWRKRQAIQSTARISPAVFRRLLSANAISARKVAEL